MFLFERFGIAGLVRAYYEPIEPSQFSIPRASIGLNAAAYRVSGQMLCAELCCRPSKFPRRPHSHCRIYGHVDNGKRITLRTHRIGK